MEVTVLVMNAFDIQGKGGNPAGIVLQADSLSGIQKQEIAARAGYPETAFVSQSSSADFKLDFFTPLKQIPHCGHATIATFYYLKQTGKIQGDHSSKETIDGNRAIVFKDGLAFMEQRAPAFSVPERSIPAILRSLNISEKDLMPGLQPTVVNTGNSFLMVPIKNAEVLRGIQTDKKLITGISEEYNLIGYYPFIIPEGSEYDASARMFAPYYGIEEEAGTGMAAGPLAAYIYHNIQKKDTYLIAQGFFMHPPSPSQIHVVPETDDTGIVRLFAGGTSYVSGKKTIEING